jgi:glutamyl-tRNA synthetase
MGITHVVRGNEYLSSSPKYNRLYAAFGWDVPIYIHCPLITDEEHHKLSKRSGHSSYEDLVEQGFLTEAIVNFVSLLGWSPEGNQEIFTLNELIKVFDYHNMSKSPAVFDYKKLRWMNGEYIKALPFEKYYEMAEPQIKAVITRILNFEKIAKMVKSRIEIFPDIKEQVNFFEKVPKYSVDLYTHKKMKTNVDNSLELLENIIPVIEKQEVFENDELFVALKTYAKDNEYKVGFVMWPIRTALSGKQMTPAGATEILEVLGKEESLIRLKEGIDKLKNEK